jgi:serine/threonine protein kinase
MGNRAHSLEKSGGPSELVMNAEEEEEKVKVKEALCYLSPEQTGAVAIYTQDHRTDLYSFGIAFWCALAGNGTLPFEGEPTEVLHAIPYKSVPPVHEIRRDVPPILSMIINKVCGFSFCVYIYS